MQTSYKLSDIKTQSSILDAQIKKINSALTSAHIKAGGDPLFVPGLVDEGKAKRALVNRVGKFYGKRSKYDGSGNLRQPMKASRFS